MSDAIDIGYLAEGLCSDDGKGMRPDLQPTVKAIALAWVKAGVDPAPIELLAELLARAAAHLGEERAALADFDAVIDELDLAQPVRGFLRAALATDLDATELAALAVHLVDIAEAAALQVFVPELPKLSARSDRTGDAARRVGTARFLRG